MSTSGLPVYNVVLDYGAHRDGINDDKQHIQDAIDAASNAGGGIVYLPSGNYRITGSLTMKSSVQVVGDGPYATVLKPYHSGGSHYAAVTISGSETTYWGFKKIGIDFYDCRAQNDAVASVRQTPQAAGSGYEVDDILSLSGGSNGQVKVKAVGGNGEVLFVVPYALGSGYSAGVHATSGGSGQDCTVLIEAIIVASSHEEDRGIYFPSGSSAFFVEIEDVHILYAYYGYYDYLNGTWDCAIRRVWIEQCRFGFWKKAGTTMVFENCFVSGYANPNIDRVGWFLYTGYDYTLNSCSCDRYSNGSTSENDGWGANMLFYSIRGLILNAFYFEGHIITDSVSTHYGAALFINVCSGALFNGCFSASPYGSGAKRNIILCKTGDYKTSNRLIMISGSSVNFNGCSFGGSKEWERYGSDCAIGGEQGGYVYTIQFDESDRGGTARSAVGITGCSIVRLDDFPNSASSTSSSKIAIGALSAGGGNQVLTASYVGYKSGTETSPTDNYDPSGQIRDYVQNQGGNSTICWIDATGVHGT